MRQSEATITRGYGSKAFACIEGFNEGNSCVKHIWQEAQTDEERRDWETYAYQMYLLFTDLVRDENKRWHLMIFNYEDRYIPGMNKGYTYIYESGNQEICTTEQPDTSGENVPERRPSRAERKRARRRNYQKFMANIKKRR